MSTRFPIFDLSKGFEGTHGDEESPSGISIIQRDADTIRIHNGEKEETQQRAWDAMASAINPELARAADAVEKARREVRTWGEQYSAVAYDLMRAKDSASYAIADPELHQERMRVVHQLDAQLRECREELGASREELELSCARVEALTVFE